ncbi:MAG: hypothetical protein ACI9JN_000424, partial [Bacteroidia bacterium]
NEAYLRVYRNKEAGGADNVQVTELKSILKTHGTSFNVLHFWVTILVCKTKMN